MSLKCIVLRYCRDSRFRPAEHQFPGRTLLWTLFFLVPSAMARAEEWRFHVRFTPELQATPYTGRVYLFFSREGKEPRLAINWFHPEPFLSRDVVDWKPGETLTISTNDEALRLFPKDFRERPLTGLQAQAVVRLNPHERTVGNGPGNGYSNVVVLDRAGTAEFTVRHFVPHRAFRETEWTKELVVPSPLLSRFHDRDMALRGAVTLPASYFTQPDRRYPVILEVPGFGGTHHHGIHEQPVNERNTLGIEFIRVMLDPSCPLGHHVFANSDNNGPYGDALVREFLPALDREFRTISKPEARFLTGHSSGGWSTLWLQVSYPDHFGGTWSTAPDPVDFRSFQYIDIYRPGENMYFTPEGGRRPLARAKGEILLWYDDFVRMEETLGHGGQLHSFEAVFSRRGADGRPQLLWDRETGEIDAAVAESWKRYDIRLIIEEHWEKLEPQLAGKLRVFMGTEDTFYLEEATELLKESLMRLGSDAQVEMLPGRDHFDLFQGGLKNRIEQQMAEKWSNAAE